MLEWLKRRRRRRRRLQLDSEKKKEEAAGEVEVVIPKQQWCPVACRGHTVRQRLLNGVRQK